eukprot:TRINITY_DN2681_c0_g1_i3.p1 TRINITY_DN2681_c0_g1~~TRINITY_DN2681_c0_g1_i3.p1  ORF type:complete len:201 (-),score=41.91 TRINITY_DN2681_c0_g1_i3:589-1191(-)
MPGDKVRVKEAILPMTYLDGFTEQEFAKMCVVLHSPNNLLVEAHLVQKATGFYGIRFVPRMPGTYFCQILDPYGVPTSVRPFEILVREKEVPKTPRVNLTVSPRDKIAIRSHSEGSYKSPREREVLKEKASYSSVSEQEEAAPSSPEQLTLEIRELFSKKRLTGKAFQIPVVGEDTGAYFVQFSTGIFSFLIFSSLLFSS